MLALSGCGDKEEPSPVPAEQVEDGADSSEGPEDVSDSETQAAEDQVLEDEDGVSDAGGDVTSEDDSSAAEDDAVDDAASDTSDEEDTSSEDDSEDEAKLTAENFKVVSLKDLKAYPEEMHISVGTTVEWRNINDNLQHIIGWKNQKSDGVKPEPILAGESWSYTFNEPGTVKWFSTARPTIQGTIYVEE